MTRRLGAERLSGLPGGGLAALLAEELPGDVVNLAVGTPGFPRTPTRWIEAACAALRSGANQYENPHGSLELRRRIARDLPHSVDPDTELTVTVGGSEALCVALLTTVDPGDEVIVLEPFYENFLAAIALAGARPRCVPLREPDWSVDPDLLEAAFGPRTRAIVLNSPSNPTGRLLGRPDLDRIARLCDKWDVTVVSDEVYSRFVYDDARHLSVADIPALAHRSIIVGSLSKSHAVSGWRLGYLHARPPLTELLRRVHVATTAGAPAPLQRAAAVAEFGDLVDPAFVGRMRARRDRLVDVLAAAGFRVAPPGGGCYIMAGIQDITHEPSPEFARRLAAEARVLVAPATPFFADKERGARYVRIAFNREWDLVDMAAERLSAHKFA